MLPSRVYPELHSVHTVVSSHVAQPGMIVQAEGTIKESIFMLIQTKHLYQFKTINFLSFRHSMTIYLTTVYTCISVELQESSKSSEMKANIVSCIF